MRNWIVVVCLGLLFAGTIVSAAEIKKQTEVVIYPVDRATILNGSLFDVKVEFPGVIKEADAKATINGKTLEQVFGHAASFITEKDERFEDVSALILRDCKLPPGDYEVVAGDGVKTASVKWQVYVTPEKRVAKNVILMIGDGMSQAHRTAARVMSKGIKEGKFNGKLAMDEMPHMALVGTPGVDSIVTDSANSASAYATGHKTSDAALGVYADRTRDRFDDPKVETLGSLVRRLTKMRLGIVTNTEIQDATPASMFAHTRRRAAKDQITQMLFDLQPDVAMGGGAAYFVPPKAGGSRLDAQNFFEKFQQSGYQIVHTRTQLLAAAADKPEKLLGIFHPGNLDGVLDRKFLKKGTVPKFPDQPDLTEEVQVALENLSRGDEGFVLLIESGLIDKYSHAMDWERAVMDTIMFDKVIAQVKEFAAKRDDTLILVIADHTHGMSVSGTLDDNGPPDLPLEVTDPANPAEKKTPPEKPKSTSMRDNFLAGELAGYPNYVDADGDGYPDSVNVTKRLAVFFTNFPDYYETFRPKLDNPFQPVMRKGFLFMANEKYKDLPGAELRRGNLGSNYGSDVHSAEDVILTAIGPGSELVHGFMDNTEVFQVMVKALGLREK